MSLRQTVRITLSNPSNLKYSIDMNDRLDQVSQQIAKFAEEREWEQFHIPRSLVLSIMTEVGELAEVVQWKKDDEALDYLLSEKGRKLAEEEIADIAIYLIRLCQIAKIDLLKAVTNKLFVNVQKYPISESKGNAIKYTDR